MNNNNQQQNLANNLKLLKKDEENPRTPTNAWNETPFLSKFNYNYQKKSQTKTRHKGTKVNRKKKGKKHLQKETLAEMGNKYEYKGKGQPRYT